MNISSSPKGIRLQGLVGDRECVFDLGPGRHLVGRMPDSTLHLPVAHGAVLGFGSIRLPRQVLARDRRSEVCR